MNKTFVKVVVILAATGLLLSSGITYFGRNSLGSTTDPNQQNYTSVIDEMEYQIGLLEDSLEKAPDNLYLRTQLGNSYYQLGMFYDADENQEESKASFSKAMDYYGRALEIDPDDVNVRVDRAVSAYWSENNDIAEEEFEQSIEIDPTHAKAYFNYGIFLLFERNNAGKAIEKWNKVVELNPTEDPDLVAYARSWITQAEASLLELKGDPNDFDLNVEDDTEEESTN
jgi:tetratricopeptide (TPR) repeat protein